MRVGALFVFLVALPAGATPPPASVSEALTQPSHEELGPQADVYWRADGAVSVVASCAGCLLDVEAKEWLTANLERKLLDAPVRIVPGAVDEATVSVPVVVDQAFGVDLAVTLVDEQGNATEHTETFFGVVDKRGSFRSLSWADYICARGFAVCTPVHGDQPAVIDLQLPQVPNEDYDPAAEGSDGEVTR